MRWLEMITIGEKLKIARELWGMTLKDTKELTGLSISYISDIERGRTKPSLKTLKKLSQCYRLRMTEVLEGTELNETN